MNQSGFFNAALVSKLQGDLAPGLCCWTALLTVVDVRGTHYSFGHTLTATTLKTNHSEICSRLGL